MKKKVFTVPSKNINSSNIAQLVHYEEDGIPYLKVHFTNGSIYVYIEVPFEVLQVIINAESTGKAFNSLVKGKYSYQLIQDKKIDKMKC